MALLSLLIMAVCAAPRLAFAQPPTPVVAIHVSELTQALETLPASAPTPTGAGNSGFQWWYTSWHYFVAYESLQEALRADGTPFVTVSDADIAQGKMLNADGTPHYPILISLASEAVADDEIPPLRAYVNAGGNLLVGSSSFTRNPDGTSRGDFALANEMGVHMADSTLMNWYQNTHITKGADNQLTSHIPSGTLNWNGPLNSEDIPWGVSPTHTRNTTRWAWKVVASGATDLADGDAGPLLTVKGYGLGQFIYHAEMQPLIGHDGFDPGMYQYLIYRRAIESAFAANTLPVVKVSPWPFQYDAAFLSRHDFENNPTNIGLISSSAQFEKSLGVKGDYYFCTGALRDDMSGNPAAISGLQTAVSSYGATIGSHNGGLKNPVNPTLLETDTDYWHWGPDEVLDTTPPGYADGKAYASASILASFTDIEGWLKGLDNGRPGCGVLGNCPRTWVSPYFNSTRESSRDIVEQLGSITMGEQKISPFPHRTLSYDTQGKLYAPITLPVSDWYVGSDVAQAIDDPFADYYHTNASIDAAVDFYYSLGFLINFYTHSPSNDGSVGQEYVTHSMSKANIWPTNAVGLHDWSLLRSPVAVTPSASLTGTTYVATASVSGATDPNSAIEMVLPQAYLGKVTVFLNGTQAAASEYRNTATGVKVRVGSTVATVRVQNLANQPPVAVNQSYSTFSNGSLNQAAPGVLAGASDFEGASLTAKLGTAPSHGSVTLNANGSFLYTPAANYVGTDSFSFTAYDGTANSASATASITVLPTLSSLTLSPVNVAGGSSSLGTVTLNGTAPSGGVIVSLSDNSSATSVPASVTVPAGSTSATFTVATTPVTSTGSATISAVYGGATKTATLTIRSAGVAIDGTTSVDSGGILTGTTLTAPALTTYANNELLLAFITASTGATPNISVTGVAGGGLTWTLVRRTNTQMGSSEIWRAFAAAPLNSAAVTVTLSKSSATASFTVVAFEGVNASTPVGAIGGGSAATGAPTASLTTQGANSWVYGVGNDWDAATARTVGANQTILHQYLPTTGDTFWVQRQNATVQPAGTVVTINDTAPTNHQWNLSLVEIRADLSPVAVDDAYGTNANTALNQAAPGVLANDSDPLGLPLTAQLVAGPAHGSLTLNTNGSFLYTPAANYAGNDSFTYKASDGTNSSNTATVTLTVTSQLSALSLGSGSVVGGTTSQGTVTLGAPAPSGGAVVSLGSDSPAASVPASVTIAAGSSTASFTVTTTPVQVASSATISAVYGGATQQATLTINPPALTALTLSPASVTGGSSSLGTVTLSGAAPLGGVAVSLSSNAPAASVPASVMVDAGSNSASFTVTTISVGSPSAAVISAVYGAVTKTANLTVNAPVLSSLTLSQTSLTGGTPTQGTVTLGSPAPSGGLLVTLTGTTFAASKPDSVTVAAGSITASFPIASYPVDTVTNATISATFGGVTQTVTLTVNPPVLSTLTLNPTSVIGGTASQGTVTLNGPAPSDGFLVTLSENSSATGVPASVTVAGGSTSATFAISTTPVGSANVATISALSGAVTKTASLTVNTPAVASFTLTPASVTGGIASQGLVTLTGSAPSGGFVVTLSSNSSAASLPASVTVTEGDGGATFSVNTIPVGTATGATLSAVAGGATKTATLTVNPPALAGLALNPTSVTGGATSQATVTLSGAAPSGGLVITLSDNSSAASEPVSVTVPAGSLSANFTVSTTAVTNSSAATISASLAGFATTAVLTVNPPALSALTLSPTSLTGGASSQGTVTLNSAAPTGGITVALSDNSSATSVPASVTIAAGSTSASFTISTTPVGASTIATISAVYGGVTDTATLTVNAPALNSLTLNPASLAGGATSQGTVTLGSAAPTGGLVVALTSDSAAAGVPASVTVAAGATSASFTISTTPVGSSSAANISALFGGVTKTAVLTVNAPALSTLALNPTSVTGGTSSVGTVTLGSAAPSGGLVVALSSNSSAAVVPASVTVPVGGTSATFAITTTSVTSSSSATISAIYGGVTKTAVLTVNAPAVTLSTLTLNPTSVVGGASSQGTVTLSGTAPSGGIVVSLSDDSSATSLPASITVPAGSTSANFTVTSSTVTSSTTSNISAVYGGVTKTAALTVTTAGLAVDVTTSADSAVLAGTTIATSNFSTTAANELLLAFVSASYSGAAPNINVTGVTGGGLTWTLVRRTNTQQGAAEIWRAFATAALSNTAVTATLSKSNAAASITVASFKGANVSTPVGAIGGGSAATGAPSASLTTQGANSLVFGVGNDWDGAVARTVGTNQTMVHQYLSSTGDTFWVQRQNATTQPAGTVVAIGDTAPTNHQWNLSIVEIRQ